MKKFLLTLAAILGFASQAGSKTAITLDQLQANVSIGVMVNTGKGWTQAQLDPSLSLDITTVPPTLKSNGNSGPTFVDAVTPTGAVDGINTVFVLPSAPNPPASLELALNGVVQRAGTIPGGGDFSLSGTTITYITPPGAGGGFQAFYRR